MTPVFSAVMKTRVLGTWRLVFRPPRGDTRAPPPHARIMRTRRRIAVFRGLWFAEKRVQVVWRVIDCLIGRADGGGLRDSGPAVAAREVEVRDGIGHVRGAAGERAVVGHKRGGRSPTIVELTGAR